MKSVITQLSFVLIMLLSACTSREEIWQEEVGNYNCVSEQKLEISVFDSRNYVTISDAQSAASKAMSLLSGRSIDRKVKSVERVERDGDLLAYIINFDEGKGFVILSAKKSYQPILAYSEVGEYVNNDTIGSSEWLNAQLTDIQNVNELPDTVRFFNIAEWNRMIGAKKEVSSGSRSSEFDYMQYQAYEKWLSEGYEIYPLTDVLNSGLFYGEMQIFSAFADFFEHESYMTGRTVKEDSYILVKRRTDVIDPAPGKQLVGDIVDYWHQNYPYNKCIPEYPDPYTGQMVKPRVGCSAVAIGYILAYYGDLPGFNFHHIRRGIQYETEASEFLYYVGRALGIKYESYSGTSLDEIRKGLNNLGYTFSYNLYDPVKIRENISRNMPVYISGFIDSPYHEGHAWICDGSEYSIIYDECVLALVSEHAEDVSDNGYWYPHTINKTRNDGKLHFNWGYGSKNVGFFHEDFDMPENESFCVNKTILNNIRRK